MVSVFSFISWNVDLFLALGILYVYSIHGRRIKLQPSLSDTVLLLLLQYLSLSTQSSIICQGQCNICVSTTLLKLDEWKLFYSVPSSSATIRMLLSMSLSPQLQLYIYVADALSTGAFISSHVLICTSGDIWGRVSCLRTLSNSNLLYHVIYSHLSCYSCTWLTFKGAALWGVSNWAPGILCELHINLTTTSPDRLKNIL